MASTPPALPASISEGLARLWTKFLPETENRLSLVESAALAIHSGTLSEPERQSAHAAAHKLAGTLGTFGLHRGTDLARQAELAFEAEPGLADSAQLTAWVAELRQIIESRK
jgi:HPt (histidine-containing phosphotransfer) domain-containing protein